MCSPIFFKGYGGKHMKVRYITKLEDGSYNASIMNGFKDKEVPFLANNKTGAIAFNKGISEKTYKMICQYIMQKGLPESNGKSKK